MDERFDTGNPRPGVRIGIAIALLLLLAAIVFQWQDKPRDTVVSATASADTASAMASSIGVDAARSVASATSAMPGATGSDQVQLCGGTWASTGEDGRLSESTLIDLWQRAASEAAKPVMAAMLASGDPRSTAAAHYVMAGLGTGADMWLGECMDDACRLRWADVKAALPAHRDALAGLAASGSDPLVYAWAHRLCAQTGSEGGCQQISTQQWAHLDPANAVPWLHLADETRRRRDAVALDDAMFHVASSTRYEWGRGRLLAQVAPIVSTDAADQLGATALLRRVSWVDQTGLQWNGPHLGYCMPKATGDSNRRETCERVAALLAERSDQVGTRWAGTLVGATLGWSAERLDALETRRLAGEGAIEARPARATYSGFSDPTSCADLKAEADGMRQFGQLGEVADMQLAIAESGRTEESLAAEQRRKRGLPRGFQTSASTAAQMLDMRVVR